MTVTQMVMRNWPSPRYVPETQMALTRLSSVNGTMDSSGMASSTSLFTDSVARPIHS